MKKSITTYEEGREKVEDVVKSYIMIKHIVKNLAPSENRKELDGESNTVTNGVVVLGFPVDEQFVPVLQNEHIFAFLPVKKMGFKVYSSLPGTFVMQYHPVTNGTMSFFNSF